MIKLVDWYSVGKYISTAWTAIGPLFGVLVGALLARSWDRRKWLNDNRKQEYRELLTALTDSATSLIEQAQSGSFRTFDQDVETQTLYFKTIKLMQDRIFVAEEIARMKLFDRWGNAVEGLKGMKDIKTFEETFETLRKEIVAKAIGH